MTQLADTPTLALRDRIVADASTYWGVSAEAIVGPRRTKRASRARQYVWARLRSHDLSFDEIGALFGRHHTTVMYGVRSHQAREERRRFEVEA